MDIRNKRVLVFGGWGLVGSALCRELLAERPSSLVVCSLGEQEARDAVNQLHLEFPDTTTELAHESGSMFVRWDLRYKGRNELLNDVQNRHTLMHDVIDPLSEDILKASFIYRVLDRHRPDIIIDSVNSATGLAYQDIFSSSREVVDALAEFEKENDFEGLRATVERNLCTAYIPQLIRHVQILHTSMKAFGTACYIKIGTSGTGGMGLNIPYTHSEERPSRVLLSKSSIAGAHTLLLFLMGRTPDAPIIKEFKPTAAIAWKGIQHGVVFKRGQPIQVKDMPVEMAVPLGDTFKLKVDGDLKSFFDGQPAKPLTDVFIDSGENGTFSRHEFEALTSIEQMEFITPEEIAQSVLYEIKGGNTGHDVINALDQACMGPTYRAGALRHAALDKLTRLQEEHGAPSVAFETLGPPRLSKLLYEAHLLKRVATSVDKALAMEPAELSRKAADLMAADADLRARILSIGIPVLLADGRKLLRGPEVKIPPFRGRDVLSCDEKVRDLWAEDGWVDLRSANFSRWQDRLRLIVDSLKVIPFNDTSSRYGNDKTYWDLAGPINEGKLAAWIFRVEEKGARMKS